MLAPRRWYFRLRHLLGAAGSRSPQPLWACWQAARGLAGRRWQEAELLVVDAEMSSLKLREGELLSVGWVVIRAGEVQLSSATHLLLKPERSVGDSAVIHNLRDCELEAGIDSAEMMSRLLQAATGRVLVFHHARIDLAFLGRCCREQFGAPLLLPVIDTLQLEKRQMQRRHEPLTRNALRLGSCRARYNLPDYSAHNALVDALATAELLLAQVAHKGGKLKLRDLLT